MTEQVLLVERAAFGRSEEAEIVRAVRDLEGSFGLVAEEDGAVVGHVQLSRAWIGSDPVLALGPIGVLPARQGRGIGSALVEAALAAARERHEIAVILLGSQVFYPRFGFVSGASLGLRNVFTGVQEDGFVVAEEDFMVATLADHASALAGAYGGTRRSGSRLRGRRPALAWMNTRKKKISLSGLSIKNGLLFVDGKYGRQGQHYFFNFNPTRYEFHQKHPFLAYSPRRQPAPGI